MNKLYFALILLISLGMFSCETDIDVNAEYKDITTVYGLINPSESVHYIKINKAFLGAGSALDLAADANNFTYTDGELDITVQAIDDNGDVKTTYSTGLGTVIRTEKDIIKDQGIFDNSINVLYKFNASINRDYMYKVIIINTILNKEVSAESKIVGSTVVSKPSTGTKFQFWNGTVASGNSLNKSFSVTTGADIGRVGMVVKFNYTEFYTNGMDSSDHSVIMPLGDVQTISPIANESLDWVLQGETFFENISARVSSPSSISHFSHRRLENISLDFSLAGTELSTYMEVTAPSSSVNQDKPGYTNVNNGLGIVSSRETINWFSSIDPVTSNQINIQNSTILKLQSLGLGFCFGTTGTGFPVVPCQ